LFARVRPCDDRGIDGFNGTLFTPDDPGYDDARTIFNSMIDKRPAYIAQCEGAGDVTAALAFARREGLPISVRSGGHSVAGNSLVDDGLVVDMRKVNAVSVDPDSRTAIVGGGATWSHLDRAAEPHGLGTTGGRVSTTGVAGLTLGGGSGWFERKFGLACDNLISVNLVTADGRQVTASEKENPELFWALHGGGGNFGVATSFEFRLHPLPVVTLALLLFRPDRGPEVSRRYRDFAEEAPDEVGGGILYLTGPPEEFVPEQLQGQLTLGVAVMYPGGEAEAREVAAPLLELSPDGQMIAEMPYAELQCALDDPPGFRNYWSAEHLEEFPDQAIDLFCARAEDMIVPSPSQQIVMPWGGAVARNAGDWPLASRHARWTVHPFGLWDDPADDDRGKAWARASCTDMKPYATGDVYLNFVGDEGEDRIQSGFGDKYERLAAVKAEWDPDNVFRQNHNVKPLAEAA
jgi:FAD/FMN-containing dehydrogenase